MIIELLRGLAALMVLITHYVAMIPGAHAGLAFLWTGVDLFFVISGFVFAPMVLNRNNDGAETRSRALESKQQIKAFFIRRWFRIYPLYVVVLLAYFFVVPAAAEKAEFFWRHLFFLHTTRSYAEAFYFNPAFWTLPAEVEYYFFLPLLVLLAKRKTGLLQIFCITLIINLVANSLKGTGDNNWRLLSVHLPALLPEFLAGVYLYAKVQQAKLEELSWKSPQALFVFLCGVVVITYAYVLRFAGLGWDSNALLNAPFNFLCAIGYALMAYPLLLIKETSLSPTLITAAYWAGASSYGVYLLHNLTPRILSNLGFVAEGIQFVLFATAITYAVAFMLYYFYENPLRKLGRRLGKKLA